MRALRIATVGGLLGGGFYLLLIDTRELPELYVLPAIVALAAAALAVSAREGITDAVIELRWLDAVWRAIVRVPGDAGRLVIELVLQLRHPRPVRGSLRTTAIPVSGGGRGLGRAAVTEALGSLAPNTIVIGADTERGVLLVHQLRRHGTERDLDVVSRR